MCGQAWPEPERPRPDGVFFVGWKSLNSRPETYFHVSMVVKGKSDRFDIMSSIKLLIIIH